MERLKNITIIFLLAVALLSSVVLAKSTTVLLQEGLYAEQVDGDLDAAIRIYGQIIKDSSAQRSHIAQAMYRQGMCYLKKQDEQQAKEIFARLVANYSDQAKIVEKVKPMLDELGNADPAALMPPETLIYIETGSPGRQIETILNMLKGTPFENPLAAIGGGKGPGPGGKSPGDIMAALMNPSMIAEFKKIRGMGIGITGVAQNNPPVTAVLFPGKSDALRGIILAALGMVGKPGEPIQGMQTVTIAGTAGVAYDDNIVIIAQPAEQLTWSVKQYKGLTSEPTLASSNKSFAKLSKKARQENAITIWANIDEVFEGLSELFPEDSIPGQIRIADGIVDFKNIDDLTAFFNIQEDGIAFEESIAFKDGHRCLAYNMIRTPNLSRAGFEAVPSEAVALVSVALGEAESAQTKAIGKRIESLTGLDIGREIFANIEQITLFALPPESASDEGNTAIPPIVTNLGLAITSHNPQQTREILTQMLTVANLVAGQSVSEQPGQSTGKYQIGLVNNQKLYCYMNQMNKTTVLSLNPDVVETSISAIKRRRSVFTAGPLQEAVNKLPPTTSKLALVNVGGGIRLAESNIDLGPKDAENSPHQLITQLAKSCDETSIQLRTDERINDFNVRLSIEQLPPLDNVFPLLMQLSESFSKGKAEAKAWKRKKEAPANIRKASQAPVIDGTAEDLWSEAHQYKIGNVIYSPVSSDQDFSAYYKAIWDEDNLYLLVDVTDDSLKNDSDEFWRDDCVEVFIDADNSKSDSYDGYDGQYHFDWGKISPTMDRFQHGNTANIKFAMVTTENGYRTEIKFPWSTVGIKPSAGALIGLDVHVNDDDDGDDRDTKITWHGEEDNAWQNPRAFGTAELAGLVGWWKLDENSGETAEDSAGNNDGRLVGGPQWQPSAGKIGGALSFDGVDDYVETDYAADLPVWTVAVWVNSPAAPTSAGQSGPVHREKNYQINWDHGDTTFRGAAGVQVGGIWHDASCGTLEANKWYHLAATYDGENLKAYKDGVLITNNSAPSGSPEAESETLKLGCHAMITGYFGGTIDDVRIYNYALSEGEITALYNEGK